MKIHPSKTDEQRFFTTEMITLPAVLVAYFDKWDFENDISIFSPIYFLFFVFLFEL